MPRDIALDLIGDVLRHGHTLDERFEAHPRLAGLAPRDRALARNIAATTLRRLGQIDALIGHCLERPLPGKARMANDILRIGVCQLVFLNTAAHAAVDTSVRLAEARKQGPYKKLVNAVLRRIARDGKDLAAAQDAARVNTPDWLWRSWSETYGEDTCRQIAEAHLAEPPLDLTVREGAAEWADRLGARLLPTGSLRLADAGPVTQLAGFDDGAWWVQDAAAALPVRLLGDVRGRRVIDLCAAPGGKTAQLAAAGARVIAVDRSKSRLQRVRDNLARLGLAAETVAADVRTWRPDAPADAVLLDAPCSATGTIRRHPDIPHLRKPDDIAALVARQGELLGAAAEMVAPGGVLVYAVCSLQPEEGPGVAESFLKSGAPFERIDARAPGAAVPEIDGAFLTGDGALRTLPCHLGEFGGMDGFYAIAFRRR